MWRPDAMPANETISAPTIPDYSLWQLIWSDYQRHCHIKERHPDMEADSSLGQALKWPLRVVTNVSLRAAVLVRLTCAAPRWLHWFFNSLLVALHGSEVLYGARIGPRFSIPHPFGFGIGGAVTIGTGVTVCNNVTLGSDFAGTGQPTIGDDSLVLGGAGAYGPIRIGKAAVVGANCVLEEDLPDGGIAAPARARIVKTRVRHAELAAFEEHAPRGSS